MKISTSEQYAIQQLRRLNAKGKYYLGDVLLLERFEKELTKKGYNRRQLKDLSPNYYGGH